MPRGINLHAWAWAAARGHFPTDRRLYLEATFAENHLQHAMQTYAAIECDRFIKQTFPLVEFSDMTTAPMPWWRGYASLPS